MRKILTLIPLGLLGWMLSGCEQQQDAFDEPAQGVPQDEPAEPDLQIGRGEPVEPGEPASPSIEEEIERDLEQEPSTGIEPNVEREIDVTEPGEESELEQEDQPLN